MDDLCSACLCKGRKLRYLSTTNLYNIYTQILNEIPIYDLSQICIQLCWECVTILYKFNLFKKGAKDSYLKLVECVQQFHTTTIPSDISNTPHLQQTPVKTDSYHPDVDIKIKSRHNSDSDTNFDQSDYLKFDSTIKGEDLNTELTKTVTDTITTQDELKEYLNLETGLTENTEVKLVKRKLKKVKKKVELPEGVVKVILTPDEINIEQNLLRNSEKYLDNEFKCHDCLLSFLTYGHWNDHVLDIHMKRPFFCDICTSTFDTKSLLNKHMKCHTQRYKCLKCGHLSVKLKEIILHKNSHKRMKKIKEKSPETCLKKKSNPVQVESYSETGKPKCVECDKVFSSKKTYTYHINSLHRGQNKFPCPECGKVYQWKSNLWRHLKNHKARDSGELRCVPCNKYFSSVATYRQHMKISRQHVSETDYNFTCEECGRKFVSKLKLRDHVDWEHLNRIKYKCQLCHKPFKSGVSLYIHTQNVHKNKDERDNLCHVCGKSYQNEAKLKYHIVAIHSTETPYRCTECTATFSWYSSLYRHVKEVHHKLKQNKKVKKRKDAPQDLNMEPEVGHVDKRHFKLTVLPLDTTQGNMLQTLLEPGPS